MLYYIIFNFYYISNFSSLYVLLQRYKNARIDKIVLSMMEM